MPDQLTIKNFFIEKNKIESFIFQDGLMLDHETIFSVFQDTENNRIIFGDDQDNVLIGTDESDIFNAGAGNDTMEGRDGDDFYIFNRGGGHDTIIDSGGTDTLMFGLGIAREDILSKVVDDDLILGIKEDGKSFGELSDTITIKNWFQAVFEIENVMFDNGNMMNLEDLLNQAPILENPTEEIVLQDLRTLTKSFDVTVKCRGKIHQ